MSKIYAFTSEHGPLDDYSELVVRLVIAVKKGGLDGDDRTDREEVRSEIQQIGREISEQFGHEAMTTANNALFASSSRASSAVDHMWNGIGHWMS